jgi:hypothetical protein
VHATSAPESPVASLPTRRGRQRANGLPQADRALDTFADVRRYFGRDIQLAVVLGWDEATAARWRDHVVVRPQRVKTMRVVLLDKLAREARAYLESDTDVGEWLNAPLPNLQGKCPARWLRSRGRTGLRELTAGMVDWMPRLPERDLQPIDAEQARAFLKEAADHDEGVAELERMLGGLD